MNNHKNNFLVPLLLMLFLALGVLLGGSLNRNIDETELNKDQFSKMNDIIDILDQQYVDTIKRDQLFEQTITDMLHKLDPHSNYIPAADMTLANEQIDGKFGGVGIRFAIIRDTLCVTNVIPGSPSEIAGIKAGDRIITIDKKKVAGKKMKNDQYMGMLKGTPNTRVKVEILRGKNYFAKVITRGVIPIPSIVCAEMIDESIGYIRLDQFSVSSSKEFHIAAQRLIKKGMKKLIFDLRDNGGGVLSGAVEIADEFLPSGRAIVEIRGKNQPKRPYRSTSGGILENVQTVLLINENSASASEIVAGALQDNDRATIIGRRSFGKGLVQQDFPLRDRSNLRLTIARYYTPSGRCIQRPFKKGYDEYYNHERDDYFAIDSTVFKNASKHKTVKGRIVYGGGGIMPDMFVALDTSNSSLYYVGLRYSPAFQHYAFDFVANKRGKWNSLQAYNAQFNVTPAMIDQLTLYAENELDLPINKKELKHSYDLISRALKAEIARQLFIEDGYFFVQANGDREIQKALSFLRR
jgi:carboxyl-terminal processing protease